VSALLAALAAALPNALIAIFAKLAGEAFMQDMIERVIVYAMDHAVTMTTNTLDDEIAAEVRRRLRGGAGGE
jgi:uncharacterized membrane protein